MKTTQMKSSVLPSVMKMTCIHVSITYGLVCNLSK